MPVSNPDQFLANAGNGAAIVNGQLVSNAVSTLRHEEQVAYDEALVRVARPRLRITEMLRSKGLVRNLGSLGVIISMWERSGDMPGANVSMDGRTRADQDTLTFDQVGVPIPIFHKEFELGARRLAASRAMGTPLDTDQIEIATRIISDEFETHIYNGLPNLAVDGMQVYGLTTHPDRNTGTITTSWATADGSAIVEDVKDMIQQLRDDHRFGPFTLVVAGDVWTALQLDYSSAKGDNTIMDRILAFTDISEVVPGDYMGSGNVVMVQMQSDTIDLAIGQDMDVLQWNTQPLSTEFKVFTAGAVRVKSDMNGSCGVNHWSV